MLDCGISTFDEKLFKLYDWIYFYHHATDQVYANMLEAKVNFCVHINVR